MRNCFSEANRGRTREKATGGFLKMRNKRKNIFVVIAITLSFLILAILVNSNLLAHSKNACISNNQTPKSNQDFLVFNWSVSCEMKKP